MTATAAPAPAPTPHEKKTARLEAQLAKIDADLAQTTAKHASDIDAQNVQIEQRSADLDEARAHAALCHGRVLGAEDRIRILRAQLEQANADLARFRGEHAEAEKAIPAAAEALRQQQEIADSIIGRPLRHLAALQYDRGRLLYRIEQHKARKPLGALFAGSV